MNARFSGRERAATGLLSFVRIAPRFQRAVRIDVDLDHPTALNGFLCTGTFARALTTTAEQAGHTQQGAFTWTGPYGGGKSSLLITLAALLGPRGHRRDQARAAVGPEVADRVTSHLKPGSNGWRVIPVMGARTEPAKLVWEALLRAHLVRQPRHVGRTIAEATVLDAVARISQRPGNAGLLLVIDELGKVLEHAAGVGGDLHFFQELAERASRSNGRLVVLGILHQAFDEYAGRLGKNARDEWAKVQGRYLDIPLTVTGPEQLEILARAIESEKCPRSATEIADEIAKSLRTYRPDMPASVAAELKRCWPLHPVAACLLGPLSRRRFGQNQRSLFAFLNSHEPGGFQEFLRTASRNDIYGPDQLFDYLRTNLEPAILASPDGHRWSLAVDAIERAEKHQAIAVQLSLLKAIALLDLFRERSGLYASIDVLRTVVPRMPVRTFRRLLHELSAWSVATYREHTSAFAIYAGSDFDLQAALEDAAEKVGSPELSKLKHLANLRPIVAKRHYHDTGVLRWFDVDVVALSALEERLKTFDANGAMGQFLLVVTISGETSRTMREAVRNLTAFAKFPTAVGLSATGHRLIDTTRELLALEYIRRNRSELSGDAIARREVDARTASAVSALETELRNAFAEAEWVVQGQDISVSGLAGLSRLASDIADETYNKSPRIRNELLNRSAPSSNAVAAQKALLKAMVANAFRVRLGIDGFPAEGGLYESVLASTGLHGLIGEAFAFREPNESDPAMLRPLWLATEEFLTRAAREPVTAAQLYALWQAPPFGVREGLRPVLLVAYLLSRTDRYAVYLDSHLEVALTDLTVDRLTQDPAALSLRVFRAGDWEGRLFAGIRETVQRLGSGISRDADLNDTASLARAIAGIVKNQPSFSVRTNRLNPAALAVRTAIRAASDPNTLLYESLPQAIKGVIGVTHPSVSDCITVLRAALEEIAQVYAKTLRELELILWRELGARDSDSFFADLHARAERIEGLTGDYRLEAFITRLRTYGGSLPDIEGLAGLAGNKPSRDWTDNDVNRAALEIADLAQRFNRAEAFARVKGRPDGRHAIAFVVGLDHSPQLAAREFEVTERERRTVLQLARDVKAMLDSVTTRDEVILAALAQVGSDLLARNRAKRRQAVNE